MPDWSVDETSAIATIDVGTPIVPTVNIAYTAPDTNPIAYNIISNTWDASVTITATPAGVDISGTIESPWDYISIKYTDWDDIVHEVPSLAQLPGVGNRQHLIEMIYDATMTKDEFVTIECTYEIVTVPPTVPPVEATIQQEFYWTVNNNFTGNKNTLKGLMAEEKA